MQPERREEQRGGGEKVKDMLVHARKAPVDTLCRGMCHFQHIHDYISEQQNSESQHCTSL